MHTDMTKGFDLDAPKLDPADIASLARRHRRRRVQIIADDLSQEHARLAGDRRSPIPDLLEKAA